MTPKLPHLPHPPVPPSNWNIANALTALRIALVPVFAALLLREGGEDAVWRAAAALAFTVAIITDSIDGDLARRHNLVTDVGKIADPIADKALIGTALVGLSLIGELSWWVTWVILVREVGITVLRLVVIRHGVMPAGRGGKAKTVVQTLAILLYLLPLPAVVGPVAVALMTAAVVLTVVTGLDYLQQAWRLRRDSDRTAERRSRASGGARATGRGGG